MVEQVMPAFQWRNPTRVLFGPGELSRLPEALGEVAGDEARVFLVTGRQSLRATGTLARVVESIGAPRVTLFDRATPFPSPGLVDVALSECRASSADVVVAIGGGSALDLAKLVAILMRHEGSSSDYAAGQRTLQHAGLPFVAVPTTSGSSSEVTPSSALWEMDARRSFAVSSPLMFPRLAIVDPELAMTMPKALAAATGLDAFTSAFESYWSLESQPISDAIDLEVIRLFATNLARSCIQGDIESRSMCAMAATMAGIAYSNSRPNVCHGVGFPLTLIWGVAHGQAVGVTLSTFLRWNADAIAHKLSALWDALGVAGLDEAVQRIDGIIEKCGLQTRLGGLGVTEGDMETLLDHVRWDRLRSVPRPLEREELEGLLRELV